MGLKTWFHTLKGSCDVETPDGLSFGLLGLDPWHTGRLL